MNEFIDRLRQRILQLTPEGERQLDILAQQFIEDLDRAYRRPAMEVEWYPLIDRRPELYEPVLVNRYGTEFVAVLHLTLRLEQTAMQGTHFVAHWQGPSATPQDPTAQPNDLWMPIPEPPKPEESGQ